MVVTLAKDMSLLHGWRSFGCALTSWSKRTEPLQSASDARVESCCLPSGAVRSAGNIVLDCAFFLARPLGAPGRWAQRPAKEYIGAVLSWLGTVDQLLRAGIQPLSRLKHYAGLLPGPQSSRKPLFAWQSADGEKGNDKASVYSCYLGFHYLAVHIPESCNSDWP